MSISPQFVKKNPQITFFATLNYIFPSGIYHFTSYIAENFKLFTTSRTWVTTDFLNEFQGFRFWSVNISHLERKLTKLTALKSLHIERLICDVRGITPTDLFSQNVFFMIQ